MEKVKEMMKSIGVSIPVGGQQLMNQIEQQQNQVKSSILHSNHKYILTLFCKEYNFVNHLFELSIVRTHSFEIKEKGHGKINTC